MDKDKLQKVLCFVSGITISVMALLRIVQLIDLYRMIGKYYKYGANILLQGSGGNFVIWVTVIAETLVTLGMAAMTFFMITEKMDRYGIASIAVGGGMLAEFLIILIWLWTQLGRYAGSVLFNWRMILIYAGIGFFAGSFIISGKTAKDLEDGETIGREWLRAPGCYVAGLVFILIPAIGRTISLKDILSSFFSSGQSVFNVIMQIAILILVGLYLKIRSDNENNVGPADAMARAGAGGMPPYPGGPYAPQNPAGAGPNLYQQGIGAIGGAAAYGAQQTPYGGQQTPYGAPQTQYGGQQTPYGAPQTQYGGQQTPYGGQQTPYGGQQAQPYRGYAGPSVPRGAESTNKYSLVMDDNVSASTETNVSTSTETNVSDSTETETSDLKDYFSFDQKDE